MAVEVNREFDILYKGRVGVGLGVGPLSNELRNLGLNTILKILQLLPFCRIFLIIIYMFFLNIQN